MESGFVSTTYCMQGQHYVPQDDIVLIHTGKKRRRMCEKCAEDWRARKKHSGGRTSKPA